MPAVGDLAPEFALPDETGTIHRLADQRGRWTILYFYPEDDTPGCTTEACEFRDRNDVIHERGADVWGVSPDGAASHRKFREKFELPFTLLADEGHPVADAVRRVGREAELRQDLHGPHPLDLPDRPRRPHRPGLAEGQGPGPRRGRPGRARRTPGRARLVTEPAASAAHVAHDWRPARFMVIAAHPDDADFGPAATAARWIDAGSEGWLVCCTSGDQGGEDPRRRPARAGRPARDASSAPRPRSSAMPASPSCTPPTAPSPTTSPCASSSSARSGPSGRTRSSPPTPRRVFYKGGGINHTDHRAAGMAAVDAVYPAARNPMAFPWLARDGLAAHKVRRLYLFWSDRSDTWVDVSATLERKIAALARARQPDPRPRRRWPSGSAPGRPRRASRSGRPRPRACAWS